MEETTARLVVEERLERIGKANHSVSRYTLFDVVYRLLRRCFHRDSAQCTYLFAFTKFDQHSYCIRLVYFC